MNSKKKKIIKWSILMAILFVVAGTTYLGIFRHGPAKRIKNQFSSSKLTYGEGFTIEEVKGDKRVYRVTIGSFSIERAKIRPIAIGPSQMAHLNKVHIDLYSEGLSLQTSGEGKFPKPGVLGSESLEGPINSLRRNSIF
jgi:hypothetical protein